MCVFINRSVFHEGVAVFLSVFSVLIVDRMYTTETLTSVHSHCSFFVVVFSFFSLPTVRHRSVVQYTVDSPCTHKGSKQALSHVISSASFFRNKCSQHCHLVPIHGSGAGSLKPRICEEATELRL